MSMPLASSSPASSSFAWVSLALLSLVFGGVAEASQPGDVARADAPKAEGSGPDLTLRAAPARPAIKTIAILLISGEQFGFDLTEVYSNARRVIEANTTLNVASPDALIIGDRAQVIRECAGRGACFAEKVRAAAGSSISLLLTVSADQLDQGYLLGFRLVDVETSKEIGAAGDELPVGMSLLGAMEQQLPSVFSSDVWGQLASVAVESNPENAEVSVAGRSCVSPCELTRLPTGEHQVVVRKEGYLPWEGVVRLEPRGKGSISVKLEQPERSITSSWLFWTAIGAVVVGGGVTAVALLTRPTDRIYKVCIGPENVDCP